MLPMGRSNDGACEDALLYVHLPIRNLAEAKPATIATTLTMVMTIVVTISALNKSRSWTMLWVRLVGSRRSFFRHMP